jgi:lysophospholipase L1-like esterase
VKMRKTMVAAICLTLGGGPMVGPHAFGERVWIIGGSTVASYGDDRRPVSGWGEQLPRYFDDRVTFVNRARSGQSARLYIESGRWKDLLGEMQKGDYLLVHLVHNDEWPTVTPQKFSHPDTTFQQFLRQYVADSRAIGVIPILMTPVERMTRYDAQGNFHESHYLNIPRGSNLNIPAPVLTYPQAVRKVAAETETPCLDLQARSAELLINLGQAKGLELYMVFPANTFPNWPKGNNDREHLCVKGATICAGLVAQEIVRLNLPLAKFVKPETLSAGGADEVGAKLAAERKQALMDDIDSFRFTLRYGGGTEDKPFYELTLSTKPVERDRTTPFTLDAGIDKETALKVIAWMADSGILAVASDTQKTGTVRKQVPGSCYMAEIAGGKTLLEYNFWWGAGLAERLEALRALLKDGPAKQMDTFLGRLSGYWKGWAFKAYEPPQ